MPDIYLIIEAFKRELTPKIYLAAKILKDLPDTTVHLISSNHPAAQCIPIGSIVLLKDHSAFSRKYIKRLKTLKCVIYALDEEGLLFHNELGYLLERAPEDVIKSCDIILCQSKYQFKTIKDHCNNLNPNKIKCVGHPKFDLCALRKDNSCNFKNNVNILFMMRFAFITNPLFSSPEYQKIWSRYYLGVKNRRNTAAEFQTFLSNEKRIFELFLESIFLLANNGFKVSVRPHPAEPSEYYEEIFSNNQNILIDLSKSSITAASAADLVVHDACTTSIESIIMGKIVYSLRPPGLSNHYLDELNDVSCLRCNNSQTLFDQVRCLSVSQKSPALILPRIESSKYFPYVNPEASSSSQISSLVSDSFFALASKKLSIQERIYNSLFRHLFFITLCLKKKYFLL